MWSRRTRRRMGAAALSSTSTTTSTTTSSSTSTRALVFADVAVVLLCATMAVLPSSWLWGASAFTTTTRTSTTTMMLSPLCPFSSSTMSAPKRTCLGMAKRAKSRRGSAGGGGAGAAAAAAADTGRAAPGYSAAGVYDADLAAAEQARTDAAERRRRRLDLSRSKRTRRAGAGGSGGDDGGGTTEKDDPEWKFFDTARLHVSGGDGGNGCVAFRREKGEPMGGPAGGRGGRGGSVLLVCDSSLNTLAPVRNKVHVRAIKGKNGIGKNKDGASGQDLCVRVPPGTVVRELHTQKLAGELRSDGESLLVARGGRGGRGNAAFSTSRRTAPRLAERGEPGASRWLSLELRLVADVGFLGKPNAGKSTLLAASTSAKPKIADYPFTTIVPNLGVCDNAGGADGSGLVLCDIPGLIEGAADGVGMGTAFLRHVQRCRVLLHVVDGTSDDPINDFVTINTELRRYDECLADKPQVVVLNKIDVPQVRERQDDLIRELKMAAGHSRVLPISAATTQRVSELMSRLKKFVDSQPRTADDDLPPPPEVDFSVAALDTDSDMYVILSDPAYPGQWRIEGTYIEQVAKMTHWEYPEAVERFGRQLDALGIAAELERRGAVDGDLVMVGEYDFDFAPGLSNPYMPPELLEEDARRMEKEREKGERRMMMTEMVTSDRVGVGGRKRQRGKEGEKEDEEKNTPWRPFPLGGFLDVDTDELLEFDEDGEWEMLDGDDGVDFDMDDENLMDYEENGEEEETWMSS